MSESGKVVVTKAKLDELANRINEKAGSTGPKTIAELTQTVANIPSALVTSVNGATGDVKSTFYVLVTKEENNSVTVDKTPEEVYAAYTAGYAVYAIVNRYTNYPTILPLTICLKISEEVLLVFVALTGPKSFMAMNYNGYAWSVKTGTLANSDDIPTIPEYLPNPNALNIKIGDTTTSYDGSAAKTVEIPKSVPSVTTADNGKFLRVANGAWAAVEIANANGVSF